MDLVLIGLLALIVMLITPRWIATSIYGGVGLTLCIVGFVHAVNLEHAKAFRTIAYALPWALFFGPILMMRRFMEPEGPHWTTRCVLWAGRGIYHLIHPTAGVDITEQPDEPAPEPELGRDRDSQARFGLLDAILGGGPSPPRDQRQGQGRPQQPPRRERPQQNAQEPPPEQREPEDYDVVPDEELFGDVDDIEDQYRQ